MPGGLASLGGRVRRLRRALRRAAAAAERVKIAWERHGAGPPLLLIHGLGYARWGWEPVVEPLARSFDVILFDNRGIGESDAPPGPYTAAEMAGDALQVLDEAGVERAHVRRHEPRRHGRAGARAGAPGARRPARARLHDARAARAPSRCRSGRVRLMPRRSRAEALRRFVENALAPGAAAELVERILRAPR